MAKLFSDEWFSMVENKVTSAGDLEVPESLQSLVLNLTVTGCDVGDVQMSVVGGSFQRGHAEAAVTSLTLPEDLARRLFIEQDQSAGMQGFMNGQIKVEGDMSKLMMLQAVSPSEKQVQLQKEITEATD